ncbi:hypothetical protein PACTADRAFT_1119 [Pachysolen tannophilus NRRL Y-2460]|uniref:Cohesin loading factor n=1 Tax=Pachysolen tannophilus NRRL Y-2460 TaxID=669874 RepID=A0A1E4TXM1_PACTA|nr:hypothetical protein PACTADRAFT_1119 [Pachysolen tannophilus NRRL Y-2460]
MDSTQAFYSSQPIGIPSYAEKSICQYFGNIQSENSFKIYNLLYSSDNFLRLAHEKVGITLDLEGNFGKYCQLIKASIKCLLILVKKYQNLLDLELQILIYLKLSKLYYFETENHDLAEEFINKGISLATRNNLINLKFQCEYLALQISIDNNQKFGLKYLNLKIEEFESKNFKGLSNFLKLLKFKYINVIEPKYSLNILRDILQDSNGLDLTTRQLILINQVSIIMYNGNMIDVIPILNELDYLQKNENNNLPQLISMKFFFQLLYHVKNYDMIKCKEKITEIDEFVKLQNSKNWQGWNANGEIILHLNIPLEQANNVYSIPKNEGGKQYMEISYKVSWLNSNELLLRLYFLSGLAYLNKSYDGKEKSLKFFHVCKTLINNEFSYLNHLTASLQFYEMKILTLNYFKILINYYEILARFISNDFKLYPNDKDAEFFKFIDNYNAGMFSSQELIIYHKLIPKILYLFGCYYQQKQRFYSAKNYFIKLKTHLSDSSLTAPVDARFMNDPIRVSLIQFENCIGGDTSASKNVDNEYFILSNLNLLLILSWELKITKSENEFIYKNKLKNEMLNILQSLNDNENDNEGEIQFSNKEKKSVLISNSLLILTIKILQVIYNSSTLSEMCSVNTENTAVINVSKNINILSSIIKSSPDFDKLQTYSPVLTSVFFYISSFYIKESARIDNRENLILQNFLKCYNFAKISRNSKFLLLSSYKIYQLMSNSSSYSVEEVEDQKLKYLNYLKLYKQEFSGNYHSPLTTNNKAIADVTFETEGEDYNDLTSAGDAI